jgi:glycogen operon protein
MGVFMTDIIPSAGHPLPLGITIYDTHVRFSIFSRHASQVWLMLFDHPTAATPSHEFTLDPLLNRTGDIWHIDLAGVQEGQLYLYRMDGPYEPLLGNRYNPNRGLLDPYARALTHSFNAFEQNAYGYALAAQQQDMVLADQPNFGPLPKCVVVSDEFDWQGDRPLNRSLRHTIIYEAHVRGLSQHPSAHVSAPGTYRGLIELIPHFQDLGITAIELLPIQTFDHTSTFTNPYTGHPLTNYWGYSTLNFFAPECRYSAASQPGEQIREFKELVREMHKAGLEIILDVVYNHTGEGNHLGPTVSFKGIDNQIYYLLEENKRFYRNYAGTGNTVNCNHPVVRDFILDSLRYWVTECHVDGFRFDLASILGRDQVGQLLENPPIVERIAEDPILRNTKIIAEAWDAAGAYQVGEFPGRRWAEWNGRYRDDVRRFWRGDPGLVGQFATRFAGSSDLYANNGRSPINSINFITSHDGFTLNDLVSYSQKHNLANGENNQDGDNQNHSANLGHEGPTADPTIEWLRIRRIKNFLATLMLSQGVPMLLGGDEFRRTQQGNNNAYAQDNEISWIDWTFKQKNYEIYRFAKAIIAFRKRHPIFYRSHFFTGQGGSTIDIQWFSHDCDEPDWGETGNTLMVLIDGSHELIGENRPDCDALLLFNPGNTQRIFTLPAAPRNKQWRRIIDTALLPPFDIRLESDATPLNNQAAYAVHHQTMVVMISA